MPRANRDSYSPQSITGAVLAWTVLECITSYEARIQLHVHVDVVQIDHLCCRSVHAQRRWNSAPRTMTRDPTSASVVGLGVCCFGNWFTTLTNALQGLGQALHMELTEIKKCRPLSCYVS